jgi:hypothetical protein
MAKTYNRLEIDVNKKPNSIITEVQGDSNSRYLDVSLFNNGVPLNLTGHEVKIFMVKPENGGEIWNDGVITDATAGRCEFLMTTEALARMGHLQTQISVWKDNTEILSTQVFEIYVTKTLLGNSSVESSNEYGTLVVLFQNLYEAYALMTDMVSSFGKKGAVADARDIATFWQGVEYLAKYMDTDLKGLLEKAIANSSVQGVLDLIGTSGDSGNSTVFGCLNSDKKFSKYCITVPEKVVISQKKQHNITDSPNTLLTFALTIDKDMYLSHIAVTVYSNNNTRNTVAEGEIQLVGRTYALNTIEYNQCRVLYATPLGDFVIGSLGDATSTGNNNFMPLLKKGSTIKITTKRNSNAASSFDVKCEVIGTSFQ